MGDRRKITIPTFYLFVNGEFKYIGKEDNVPVAFSKTL